MERHGIVMTVGVYANATGNTKCAQIQKTVVQTIMSQEHILQVHGFYYYDDRNLITVDVVPDMSVTDDEAFIKNLLEQLGQVLPDQQISIVIDHNYSD